MSKKPTNIHGEKCLYWYDNHPSGAIGEELRFFGRDIPWVARCHTGDMADWKDLCYRGWHSKDKMVRNQCFYSIPAMLKVKHLILRGEIEIPEETAKQNRDDINLIVSMMGGKLSVASDGWVKGPNGWERK